MMHYENEIKAWYFRDYTYPAVITCVLSCGFGMEMCMEAYEWRETKRRIGA